MNSKSILYILDKLGIGNRVPGSYNVYCTCPLAKYTHPKGVDNHPSMSIKVANDDTSVAYCWATNCGFKGTVTTLVSQLSAYEDGRYDDLLAEVREMERGNLSDKLKTALDQYQSKFQPKGEIFYDDKELDPYKGKIPKYAIERGLTVETCKQWELGYDKKAQRLVFPVRNFEGKLVGMMGRGILPTVKPKWWIYWHFLKSKYLFGEHKLDLTTYNKVVVTEGMLDAVWLWQLGVPNVLSIQGSKLANEQATRILNLGVPTYLMMDGDASGRSGQVQMVNMLRGKLPLYTCSCPDGSDPAKLDKKQAFNLIDNAEFVI